MRYIQDASPASQPPRRSPPRRAPLCLSLVTRRPLPSRPLSPPSGSAALAPSRSVAPPASRPVILPGALLLAQVDKLGDILARLELLVQSGRRLARLRSRFRQPRPLGPPPRACRRGVLDLSSLCALLPASAVAPAANAAADAASTAPSAARTTSCRVRSLSSLLASAASRASAPSPHASPPSPPPSHAPSHVARAMGSSYVR